MSLKKLASIFFILLISILHTITLTFWLSEEKNLVENNNDKSSIGTDSLFHAKRSNVIPVSEFTNVHQ